MISTRDKENDTGMGNVFLTGLILQFINPKGVLMGVTVTATFIVPYSTSYLHYLSFSLLLGTVGFISTFSWNLLGSLFQKLLVRYDIHLK